MPPLSAQKPERSRRTTANTGYGNDLTTEILLRLPAKSLLKFKTVSKQWLSIVSSRQFRQVHSSLHSGRNLTATGLFLTKHENLRIYNSKSPPTYLRNTIYLPLKEEQAAASTSISSPFDSNHSYGIISSCNGLLLLNTNQSRSQAYYVCNPTTKKIKPLIPDIPKNLGRHVRGCLAFDPSKSPHYKVAFFWINNFDPDDPELHIVIHSSEAGIRSRSMVIQDTDLTSNVLRNMLYSAHPVFCNGVIHWVSSSCSAFFYFDIDREFLKEGPSPPGLGWNRYFGESRGRLRLARVSDTNNQGAWDFRISMLDVYELEWDYSGWILEYRIDLSASVGINIISETGGYYWYTVVSILGEEKDELTMVFRVCDVFVVYHPGKKTVTKLSDVLPASPADEHDYNHMDHWWRHFHQHTETLACLS